jgi:hypothetical protein
MSQMKDKSQLKESKFATRGSVGFEELLRRSNNEKCGYNKYLMIQSCQKIINEDSRAWDQTQAQQSKKAGRPTDLWRSYWQIFLLLSHFKISSLRI